MKRAILSTIFIVLAAIAQAQDFEQQGKASFYADRFEGRTTASGERYSHKKATCAHLSLPFGTLLKVTNLANNKTAVVRVNDRGPFVTDRIIDISKSVAERLDFVAAGVADVKIEIISNEGEGAIAAAQTTTVAQENSPQNDRQQSNTNNRTSKLENVAKPSSDISNTNDTELFEVNIEKIEPKGYTVQIASYKELISVLRIAADVEDALNEKVRVQVTTLKGERIYRIMVGKFSDSKDARKFRDKAAKIYNDCFVVNLGM